MAFWIKLILYVLLAIFSHYSAWKGGEYREGGDGGPLRGVFRRFIDQRKNPQPGPHPSPSPSGTHPHRPRPFRHGDDAPDVSRIG